MATGLRKTLAHKGSDRILRALRGGSLSLTRLAEETRVTKPTVLRAIKPLVDAGIIQEAYEVTPVGRERIFQAVPFSLHTTQRDGLELSWAATGALPWKRALLHQVPPGEFRDDLLTFLDALDNARPPIEGIRMIILFGSVARGEGTWKSDLDLAFVIAGDLKRVRPSVETKVRDLTDDPDLAIRHPIQPFFLTPSELKEAGRASAPRQMLKEIMETGIVIHGNFPDPPEVWRSLAKYRIS